MGGSRAGKFFCEDAQHAAGKGTPVVVTLFSSVPAAAYHFILAPLPPIRLGQRMQNCVSKSFTTKCLPISMTSQAMVHGRFLLPVTRTFLTCGGLE